MSSAKTIADILSFSELVDGKSFIGNPFTSQPMYIAACAFLMESAYYSLPSFRSGTPPSQPLLANQSSGFVMPSMDSSVSSDRKSNAKHILLASAANENYQRCYKALKALDAYWEGTGYILTVLDQKAKGIVDPLLYTKEDMDNTPGITPGHPLAGGWRGPRPSVDLTHNPPNLGDLSSDGRRSPKIDPSQGKNTESVHYVDTLLTVLCIAIGWALTGATNSSQPNLSLLYQMPTSETETPSSKPAYSSQYTPSYPAVSMQTNAGQSASSFPATVPAPHTHEDGRPSSLATSNAKYSQVPPRAMDADSPYFLGMNSPYAEPNSLPAGPPRSTYNQTHPSTKMEGHTSTYPYSVSTPTTEQLSSSGQMATRANDLHPTIPSNNSGMMIESHDVDVNALQHPESFPFSHGEILPWLEYLPQDVLSFFGDNQNYPIMSPDDATPRPPP